MKTKQPKHDLTPTEETELLEHAKATLYQHGFNQAAAELIEHCTQSSKPIPIASLQSARGQSERIEQMLRTSDAFANTGYNECMKWAATVMNTAKTPENRARISRLLIELNGQG